MYTLTIRGHDLSGVTDFHDLGQKAAAAGIHNLQLALNMSFPQMSDAPQLNPGLGRHVTQALAASNVQVGILSCYVQMMHPDLAEREKAIAKFETYLQHARYFGAAMVASETGSLSVAGYTEENFTDEAFSQLVAVIKRLVACGERHNTLVAIEAGLNHPLYSLDRIEQLLQEVASEHLQIILDPTNLITAANYQTQVDLVAEAFARFGEQICAFHLKDFIVADNQIVPVNLGAGVMEYQKILDLICRYKPYCYVVLEETKDGFIKDAVNLIEAGL